MRVAVTGATGLIGGALVPALRAAGQEIVVVSRRPAEAVRERFRGESGESGTRGRHDGAGAAQTVADRPRASDSADEPGAGRDAAHGTPPVDATSSGSAEPTIAGVARWDPSAGEIDAAALDGVDAAVHLAGESVMGLWTDRKKQRIRRSRIDGTRLFSETVAGLDPPPATLVSASGINVYGDRPFDEPVDERSGPGEGFLAELGREWEAATRPASEAGIRVVNTRIGLVLSPRGGLLRVMLPIFRLGLGGRIGDPERPWS
ncbi:MAG: NAD-dependent epimerase/dehydratase family protein [Gemmatimonadota bacterium]